MPHTLRRSLRHVYAVERDADNVTIVEGVDLDETTLDAVCIR
jgi:hypothetical protein